MLMLETDILHQQILENHGIKVNPSYVQKDGSLTLTFKRTCAWSWKLWGFCLFEKRPNL